jgi:hypothetical protein
VPTFHGDLRLEATSEGETKLTAFDLRENEAAALRTLSTHALKKRWADDGAFGAIGEGPYRTKRGHEVMLRAPLAKVQAVVSKLLKPGRPLLHAVTYGDGSIEQVSTAAIPPAGAKRPRAGATVAQPTIGCPVPEFPESEVRANRVLREFLPPDAYAEYERLGAITAIGADTGHEYVITHRERRGLMRSRSYRSLYDLTEDRALCVHDWTVPAPEEMLALLLCVTLPGNESRVRALPEALQ